MHAYFLDFAFPAMDAACVGNAEQGCGADTGMLCGHIKLQESLAPPAVDPGSSSVQSQVRSRSWSASPCILSFLLPWPPVPLACRGMPSFSSLLSPLLVLFAPFIFYLASDFLFHSSHFDSHRQVYTYIASKVKSQVNRSDAAIAPSNPCCFCFCHHCRL